MPIFVAILIAVLFMGGLQSSNNSTRPAEESDVIVSGFTGGLARNTEEGEANRFTPSITVRDKETVETSSPVTTEQAATLKIEIPPLLDTLSAQDVSVSHAKLRGKINFVDNVYKGKLYFVYSDRASDVRSLNSGVAQLSVTTLAKDGFTYSKSLYRLADDTTYYYRVCFDAGTTTCGDVMSFTTVDGSGYSSASNYKAPTATTYNAEKVQGEYATLVGSYRLNSAEYTTAFFVYGEDWDLIRGVSAEYDYYSDVDEDGDNLQKVKAKSNMTENGGLEKEIDDLETSTLYYYSFCIAYDDDARSGISCGSTRSFETKSRQMDIPEVYSETALRSGSSVTLSSVIDMEDYRNGHAFVVYGTLENSVEAVEDLYQFSRIRQNGDKLQRLSIDDDFDNRETVSVTVYDLLDSTYYYLFCVEYEAENKYGNDALYLACGEVKSF